MPDNSDDRYAVYFFPDPQSLLADLGQDWLGRDVGVASEIATRPSFDLPSAVSISMWWEATRAPRHYGFHATLKAPFRLAKGESRSTLEAGLAALAADLRPFDAPALQVTDLAGFLALCLSVGSSYMGELADRCVTELDRFRAPLSPADQARRRPQHLTPKQRNHLDRWGYPYVLDMFYFHMTLTGRLSSEVKHVLMPALQEITKPVCREPFRVDRVSLFHQATADAPFVMIRQFPFGAGQTA